jgi:hypothetical protein
LKPIRFSWWVSISIDSFTTYCYPRQLHPVVSLCHGRLMKFSALLGGLMAAMVSCTANATVLLTESQVGNYSATFVADGHYAAISISGLGGLFRLYPLAVLNSANENLFDTGAGWSFTHSATSNLPDNFGSLSDVLGNGEIDIATLFFVDTFTRIIPTNIGETYTIYITDIYSGGIGGSWTASVEGIPEPASWGLLLAGFFGTGVALRSSRTRRPADRLA